MIYRAKLRSWRLSKKKDKAFVLVSWREGSEQTLELQLGRNIMQSDWTQQLKRGKEYEWVVVANHQVTKDHERVRRYNNLLVFGIREVEYT